MPVVFIHDHCFVQGADGMVYSEGKITDAVVERYRRLSDKVVIVSRMRVSEDFRRLVPLSPANLRMAPVKGLGFTRVFGMELLSNIGLLWREIGTARIVVLRLPSLLSVMAAPILLLHRVPYVVEVVGLPREGLQGKGRGLLVRLLGMFLHHLTRWLVSRAIGAIYVTQQVLQDAYPTRGISVAASNVELPCSPISPDERDPMLLHNPVRIGLIGSFSADYKGIDLAIRALASLRENGVDCTLHILGSGDPIPYLAMAADLGCHDSVKFDGVRAGGAGVVEWLDGMDIYVQPSRTEGLPRALVEAMARGLPAVASSVGGIPELLDPRWLVPSEDADALADRLWTLITDPDARRQAGQANATRALDFEARVLCARRAAFFDAVAEVLSNPEGRS